MHRFPTLGVILALTDRYLEQYDSTSLTTYEKRNNFLHDGVSLNFFDVIPKARFSAKIPKFLGRISGDIILFVSSKRRLLEARDFVVILIFSPFATYEKTSFTE